jgi:LL-H family phage holin
MDPFVSDLINALFVALIPVGIGALGWIARSVIGYLKARMNAEQYQMLEKIAATTVASLSQTLSTKAGAEKKAAAIALVRAECAKRGLSLDEEAISTAIEAAVYRERLKG